MKVITFLIAVFVTISSLSAQETKDTNSENSFESRANDNLVNDLDSKAFLYPNPVSIGDNVEIINIDQGEEVSLFERNGTFVLNQYIDLDKQIYTNNLVAGEYVIRTESDYLKLVVK